MMSPSPEAQRRTFTAAVLVLLLSCGSLLHAADADRDLAQTIAVRQRFLQDPELAPLNLGIRVRDRVAVLWGPVPTAVLAFKAELLLRDMDELNVVRNELVVSGASLPEPKEPVATRVAMLPEEVPPSLPERVRPAVVPPPLPPMAAPTPIVETAEREPEVELPSIRLPLPPGANTNAKPMTASASTSAAGPNALEKEIQAVMQSKDTYQGIRFALRDQRIYLRAANHGNDVLHELARSLSRLPGVENVVILDKAAPR